MVKKIWEQLSLVMTLHDIGFSTEGGRSLRACCWRIEKRTNAAEDAQSKADAALDELHFREAASAAGLSPA